MNAVAKIKYLCFGLILAFALLIVPVRAQEQQPNGGPINQEPKPAGTSTPLGTTVDDEPAMPPPDAPPTPIDTQIRVLGRAAPFTGFDTPFRWGPVSLAGVDYEYIRDYFAPSTGPSEPALSLGELGINVVFDKRFHGSELTLQYSPQVVFIDGGVSANPVSNNNLSFGMAFQISPRLSMVFKDSFIGNQTQEVFPPQFLDIYQGADVLPVNFLQNNGRYLEDDFSVAFNYKLSPRWTMSIQPFFRYLNEKTDEVLQAPPLPPLPPETTSGLDFRGAIAFTYALSPHSNLGLSYGFEEDRVLQPTAASGYSNGGQVYYSQQLRRTLTFQAAGGIEVASYSIANGSTTYFTGSGTLTKTVGHSTFAVSYLRENQIANYVGLGPDERVDLGYTFPISRRLIWQNAVGYYHEVGPEPHIQGKYAQTTVSYLLPRGLSVTGNYTFRFANGDNGQQLVGGVHNTMAFGIHWTPALLAAHLH